MLHMRYVHPFDLGPGRRQVTILEVQDIECESFTRENGKHLGKAGLAVR